MSEIQSTETPTTEDTYPAYPVKTPGMDARAYSKALAEHAKAGEAYFTRYPERGYRDPNHVPGVGEAPAPAAPKVDANDQALLDATRADAWKKFGATGNSKVNELLFRMQGDVLAGKKLDTAGYGAEFAKAIETPESRATAKAVDTLAKAIDSDGNVAHNAIPRELMHGFSLPPGIYEAETTIALLKTAADLGLTDDQVAKYIELQEQQS